MPKLILALFVLVLNIWSEPATDSAQPLAPQQYSSNTLSKWEVGLGWQSSFIYGYKFENSKYDFSSPAQRMTENNLELLINYHFENLALSLGLISFQTSTLDVHSNYLGELDVFDSKGVDLGISIPFYNVPYESKAITQFSMHTGIAYRYSNIHQDYSDFVRIPLKYLPRYHGSGVYGGLSYSMKAKFGFSIGVRLYRLVYYSLGTSITMDEWKLSCPISISYSF